ncbi:metalloregulator ArsR/SmtB family transcription factor [Aquihabitans sp. G128]|uniref:ArsR/SmtB family transcription factor n=1 Tax=Aquihabitans sp. G128 TaxID=2849779 RepID=UPI001C21DDF6|nr:metalloregulator ArsR/SmtB family transcription factor [Aquihabitans sp. G128]QXC60071.1 metalloregulator ArsR/SmtB family transcription factor [Aquihabitans sp. G128]
MTAPSPGATPSAAATGPDPVFAALADPTRRQILQAVGGRGDATATELAADLPVSRQAVVKHLQSLAAAGLVGSERVGREQRYRLTPAPLDEALRWMVDVGAAWDDRLDRLRRQFDR